MKIIELLVKGKKDEVHKVHVVAESIETLEEGEGETVVTLRSGKVFRSPSTLTHVLMVIDQATCSHRTP